MKPCLLLSPVSVVQIFDRSLVHQEGLPKLPVPPLKQTCARYLAALEPLISAEEMVHTRKLVQEFQLPGGVGDRLQKSLERKARKTENWVRKCVSITSEHVLISTFLKLAFLFERENLTNVNVNGC